MIFFVFLLIGNFLMAENFITFEERIKYQYLIEKIYYEKRIYTSKNMIKPSFEEVADYKMIENKVKNYLIKNNALEKFWGITLNAQELQNEINRILRNTKDEKTLFKIFSVLNNDPYLIAETIARKNFVERLIDNYYPWDKRIHSDLKNKALKILEKITPETFSKIKSGEYRKFVVKGQDSKAILKDFKSVYLNEKEFLKIYNEVPDENKISNLIEKREGFVIYHTLKKNDSETIYEFLFFRKWPLEKWIKDQNFSLVHKKISSNEFLFYIPEKKQSSKLRSVCDGGWWESASLNPKKCS